MTELAQKAQWICTTAGSPWQERPLTQSTVEPNLWLDGTRDQTWRGFGGCFNELGWIALQSVDEAARQQVLRELFDPAGDCRFTLCRLPIGANDYSQDWYSHSEQENDFAMASHSIERDHRYLIPYIKAALRIRPDLRLFASPWSPPTWMKFPRSYNYGTLVWTPEALRGYALYFLKFVQAYQRAGITIEQVHVQNEPNSDQKFPSCVWTGEQMREFIRDYLGPLFRDSDSASENKCEIWAGTIERGDFNVWANLILSDPKAKSFVSGVGYQWAGKDAVQRTHAAWPEVPIMQTENECGDGKNSWAYAGYVFDLLQHYITNGAVGYCYWNMVLEPTGRSTWGWNQNAMISIDPATKAVIYNPEFYVMKHFGHFIRPGAIRLGLKGRHSPNAVAFSNPDGRRVAVVRNAFTDPSEISLRFGDSKITATLPAQSINTLLF